MASSAKFVLIYHQFLFALFTTLSSSPILTTVLLSGLTRIILISTLYSCCRKGPYAAVLILYGLLIQTLYSTLSILLNFMTSIIFNLVLLCTNFTTTNFLLTFSVQTSLKETFKFIPMKHATLWTSTSIQLKQNWRRTQ